jgi:hypothetical protein
MLKVASMVDIDTFIEQATKIAAKAKRNPNHSIEAKQEAHILLEQLEEYLQAEGLNVSDHIKTRFVTPKQVVLEACCTP